MMRKFWTLLALLTALLLAACSQQSAAPGATPSSQAVQPSAGAVDCTVTGFLPTPVPGQSSIIPPVSEQDWSEGPANARMTLVEYSDFQ